MWLFRISPIVNATTGAADAIIMPTKIRKSVNGTATSMAIAESILKHGLRRGCDRAHKPPLVKVTAAMTAIRLNK